MSRQPIAEYALLSDCRSAALLHRAGSVDWLCFPRYDAPSVFGRLLDERAGHWSIAVPGATDIRRRYLDGTLVLETRYETPTGRVTLTDALAVGANERDHQLATQSPHVLLRRAECTAGSVELEMEYAPRPDYGRAGHDPAGASDLVFSSPVPHASGDGAARARITLHAGESRAFALQFQPDGGQDACWTEQEVTDRLRETIAAWQSWSSHHQRYDGPWPELVKGSGVVLQGLTYQPTGAIVAAATTSLPEVVGGERNWDYRYTWIRDASLTLEALWVAACPDEAIQFFDFIARTAVRQLHEEGDLQIMFGVGGERDLSERELSHLSGWRDSRPVRVGNAAWSQRQVDVYGELLSAVHRLRGQLGTLAPTTAGFLADVADAALRRWREPDHGIWEIRDQPRHFVHSKLLCWVALDRGVELADLLGAEPERVGRWTSGREEIRRAILERGWSDRAGAFTQTFDGDALDASTLLIPIMGLLPGDDPKVRATVNAIATRLTDPRGLVYRYRVEDGLEGREGAFLLCTFWLAHALALSGETARAREVFGRAAAFVNDVGLLSEEADGATGELLGNFPQAFSHVGLVNAAWAIQQAERGRAAPSTQPLE
ncbi:MAG TPA: glycoside hydrolase family 15 protein [Gemmatimonadales bacterium]|jgi:GH15 family glucan-1,4-alpha-glucosidase|nr:glycoside hydrolase family 15 protein [Gemmatimonadales bacterium]